MFIELETTWQGQRTKVTIKASKILWFAARGDETDIKLDDGDVGKYHRVHDDYETVKDKVWKAYVIDSLGGIE